MTEPAAEYLTLPEVAEHYRTTEGTIRWWRHTGYGPKGVKLGAARGSRVLYPRAEVERFDRQLAQQAGAACAVGNGHARAG
jgi:hypothetical protein